MTHPFQPHSPLPWPMLSHSQGSRNTQNKHFFATRRTIKGSGHSRSFTLSDAKTIRISQGDEISKSWKGKAVFK